MPLTHCLHQTPDSSILIPSAVFIASLLGSGHCVAMCGGLIVASAQSKIDLALYHLGRLTGYLALGFSLGYLGEYFKFGSSDTISYIFALLMGLSFIILGISYWKNGKMTFPMPAFISKWLIKTSGNYLKKSKKTSFNVYPALIGGLSIFLPCGWLYSFALGAMATQVAWKGALIMFLFWLGTLPILTITPWLFVKVFSKFTKWGPKISSLILITIGLITILLRFF